MIDTVWKQIWYEGFQLRCGEIGLIAWGRCGSGSLTTSTQTMVSPAPTKPRVFAADQETSITRSAGPGPRSLTFRRVDLRFVRFVTRTIVPSGSFRWAAVNLCKSKGSPLAVGLPCRSIPYQLAKPTSPLGSARNTSGNGASGAGSLASVCGEKAIMPATAQPITNFLIQPPVTVFPLPSLEKGLYNTAV